MHLKKTNLQISQDISAQHTDCVALSVVTNKMLCNVIFKKIHQNVNKILLY